MALEVVHPAVAESTVLVLQLTGHALLHPRGDVERCAVAALGPLGDAVCRVPVVSDVLPVLLVAEIERAVLNVPRLDRLVAICRVQLEILGGTRASKRSIGLVDCLSDQSAQCVETSHGVAASLPLFMASRLCASGAGTGIRTRLSSLEGWCTTHMPCPRFE